MRLRITTPLSIVLDQDLILALRAEDASGSFGIQPGHAEFITCLAISVVSWQPMAGPRRFCAVHGGVLAVTSAHDVVIASREAVLGDDLQTLDTEVLAKFRADLEFERTERVESTRLQLNAIRRIVGQLGTGARRGAGHVS